MVQSLCLSNCAVEGWYCRPLYVLVECSVALTAAWKARSVSLLAFGSDSIVELIKVQMEFIRIT
jgi:hypothetical protein